MDIVLIAGTKTDRLRFSPFIEAASHVGNALHVMFEHKIRRQIDTGVDVVPRTAGSERVAPSVPIHRVVDATARKGAFSAIVGGIGQTTATNMFGRDFCHTNHGVKAQRRAEVVNGSDRRIECLNTRVVVEHHAATQ
ncbi:hypothetical protein D3C84_1020090 [compost metagenome]